MASAPSRVSARHWDLSFEVAEARPGVRILATARGIAKQNAYFLGNRDFTFAHPEIITAVREELAKVAQWTEVNRDAVAQILADATGIDIAAWKRAVQRTDYRVAPLNEAIIEKQQRVTDRFHRLGLIPNPYGRKSGLAVEPSGRLAMVVAQETVLSPATSYRACALLRRPRGTARRYLSPGGSARYGNSRRARSAPAATTASRTGSPCTGTPP